MTLIVFWLLAALVVFPAIVVVLSRNLFHAGVALITSFLGVAGIYVLLASPFIAALQVLIYAGAIAVILLFAFMLTHDIMHPATGTTRYQPVAGGIVSAITGAVLLVVALNSPWQQAAPTGVSIDALGEAFLTRYLVPFELISILLLIALVGAVIIARKEEKEPEQL